MKRFLAIGLIAVAMSVMGSTSQAQNNLFGGTKQTLGTLLGAVVGGFGGSQIGKGRGQLIAVGVGTLAGAFLGNSIGQSLDRADQIAMQRTTQHSLETAPTGTTVGWQNPGTGNRGYVTPRRTFLDTRSRQHCREYTNTVLIDEQIETVRGVACRQQDGTWRIRNS